MLKNVSLRDNQPGTKIVINFSSAVLTMLREFQYIKPTETFEISVLFGTYRIFKQRMLSRVYANTQPRLSFRCLQYTRKKILKLGISRNVKQRRLSRVYANAHAVSPVISLLASDEKKYKKTCFFRILKLSRINEKAQTRLSLR